VTDRGDVDGRVASLVRIVFASSSMVSTAGFAVTLTLYFTGIQARYVGLNLPFPLGKVWDLLLFAFVVAMMISYFSAIAYATLDRRMSVLERLAACAALLVGTPVASLIYYWFFVSRADHGSSDAAAPPPAR
jgi:hypothetical protein